MPHAAGRTSFKHSRRCWSLEDVCFNTHPCIPVGEYVSCLRCISEALLAKALGASRPAPEVARLLEAFYDRVTRLVAQGRIDDYQHDYWQSVLAVTKVAAG